MKLFTVLAALTFIAAPVQAQPLPGHSDYETTQKVHGSLQAAQIICAGKKRRLSTKTIFYAVQEGLKEKGTYSAWPWLKTQQGVDAIKAVRKHLTSDCTPGNRTQMAEAFLDVVLTPEQKRILGR